MFCGVISCPPGASYSLTNDDVNFEQIGPGVYVGPFIHTIEGLSLSNGKPKGDLI